jgi:hypothetical protein
VYTLLSNYYIKYILGFTDAAALYPGRGPAMETAGQSGGLKSFMKKYYLGVIYRKLGCPVKWG